MNPEMTDYVILSVINPAFQDNIDAMTQTIIDAGGTTPTLTQRRKNGPEIPDTNPPQYEQIPLAGFKAMAGTQEGAPGRIMFHFRLPQALSSAGLYSFLESNMTGATPPISAESIRSAYKTLWIDDGLDPEGNPTGHYAYEITVQAMRAKFLPYMPENEGGDISEFLSGYVGADPIELA